MIRKASEWTKVVKGIGAEIRHAGWTYKAVVTHLGGGGTSYYRFNSEWKHVAQSNIPLAAYRALRKALNANVRTATDSMYRGKES